MARSGNPGGSTHRVNGTPTDTWGAFRPQGNWSIDGDEQWFDDPFRRLAAQQRALAWASPTTALDLRVVTRLVATVFVFGHALLRWRIRILRHPLQRRAIAADEFRRAAERLGATWIKLGQLVAAGDGIFPDELVVACRQLHDRVRPEPLRRIERTLDESFGTGWRADLRLDPQPLAAASIAQTHRATLTDGTNVVVKIQRRGVRRRIEDDLRALSKIAPLLVGRIPVAALANPPALIDIFARCVGEELDFQVEAANACDVARVIRRYGRGGVVVPRPHPVLVRSRAMVLEHVAGTRLDDLDPRLGGQVIDTLAAMVLEGALLGGIFHGDLHPGNMAVTGDGSVVLYDFGIVARLNEQERGAFIGLVAGIATGNWRQQLDALIGLGALPLDGDRDALSAELGLDRGPIDPTTLAPDELAREAGRIARVLLDAGARLPKPLMLWGKNLAFLDAAVGRLDPDRDLVGLISGALSSFATRHGAELAHSALAGARVDRRVIAASIAASDNEMSWNEMRARRATILERQRQHRGRRGRRLRRAP
jgi:ubiquinone biosynthesis protein